MKLSRVFMITVISIFISTSALATNKNLQVVINGIPLSTDVPAQVVNGRTLVPMRAMLEKFEFNIDWIQNTKTVVATKNGTSIKLKVGSHTAFVNDEEVYLDQSPTVIKERTMVPIRFISEVLGANVAWDGLRYLVIIDGLKINDNSYTANYEEGNLIYKGEVKNNIPNGKGTVYYTNGKVKYIGNFINGKLNGYGTHYSENGKIVHQGEFENSIPSIKYTDAKYFLFNKEKKEITGYSDNGPKDVIIPKTIDGVDVISIGRGAFMGKELTSVIIPDSVLIIWSQAFEVNNLTSVTIPDSVLEIGFGAFTSNKLKSVRIPNRITEIASNMFSNNKLTSVTIPSSVTNIGHEAFVYNNLTSINIPNNVKKIEFRAFSNNKLTSVTIPSSVTNIDFNAFSYNKLTSVIIPNNNTKIEANTFDKNVKIIRK